MPWDVVSVFIERKYLDWRTLEFSMKRDGVPPPTPRTFADPRGFEAWIEYVKECEGRPGGDGTDETPKGFPGSGLPMLEMPGFHYVEAFDHIVWRRSPVDRKSLVLYDFDMSFMYTRKHAIAEARRLSNPDQKPARNMGASLNY